MKTALTKLEFMKKCPHFLVNFSNYHAGIFEFCGASIDNKNEKYDKDIEFWVTIKIKDDFNGKLSFYSDEFISIWDCFKKYHVIKAAIEEQNFGNKFVYREIKLVR